MACMEPEFFSIVKSETGEEVDSGIIHDYDWSTGNDYDWSTGNDRGIVTEGAIEDVHMDIEPPLSLEVYEEESSVDCSFDHEHEENTVDDPSEKEPLESSLAVPILSSSGPIQDPTFVEVFKYGWTGNGRGDGNPNKQDQIPGVSAIQEQQVTIKEEPSYVEDGEAKETNLIKIEPLSEKETQTGVVSMINSECHRWKSIPISPNTKYSEIVLDSSVVPLTPSNNVEPSVLQMKYIFGNQMTMLNKFQLNSGHTVKQYVMNEFCSDLPIQQPVAAAQDASTSCIDERIAKRLAGPSWHSKYSCGGCTFCEKYKTGKCIVLHKGKKKGSSKNGVHKDHKHNKTDKGISRNVSHINGVKKQAHIETPYEQKLNSNKNKLFKFRELMPKNVMELKKQLASFSYWNLNLMKKAPVAKNLSLPSNILGQVCKECQSQIKSAYHYSSFLMKCRKCRYKSYCIGAYVHHKYRKSAPLSRDATGRKSQLECACGLITESGREMANHLCCDECEYDQKSCKVYNTVQSSIDNDTECIVIDDNDDEAISVLDTSYVDMESVEDSDDCIIIDEIPSQQKSSVPQHNQDEEENTFTSATVSIPESEKPCPPTMLCNQEFVLERENVATHNDNMQSILDISSENYNVSLHYDNIVTVPECSSPDRDDGKTHKTLSHKKTLVTIPEFSSADWNNALLPINTVVSNPEFFSSISKTMSLEATQSIPLSANLSAEGVNFPLSTNTCKPKMVSILKPLLNNKQFLKKLQCKEKDLRTSTYDRSFSNAREINDFEKESYVCTKYDLAASRPCQSNENAIEESVIQLDSQFSEGSVTNNQELFSENQRAVISICQIINDHRYVKDHPNGSRKFLTINEKMASTLLLCSFHHDHDYSVVFMNSYDEQKMITMTDQYNMFLYDAMDKEDILNSHVGMYIAKLGMRRIGKTTLQTMECKACLQYMLNNLHLNPRNEELEQPLKCSEEHNELLQKIRKIAESKGWIVTVSH